MTSGRGLGLGLVTSGLGLGLGLVTSGLVNSPDYNYCSTLDYYSKYPLFKNLNKFKLLNVERIHRMFFRFLSRQSNDSQTKGVRF